jgi:hypothetical protein
MRKLLLVLAGLIATAVISAGPASANMCSPGRGFLGYLWPMMQSCQLWAPGAGGMSNVPWPQLPQNVPYQVNIPVPGYPAYLPPLTSPLSPPVHYGVGG